jgi:hypothetical protein
MLAKVTVMDRGWIEDRLHQLGWTQGDLAREAKLNKTTIQRAMQSQPIWVRSMHKIIETLTNNQPSPEIEAAVVIRPRRRPLQPSRRQRKKVAPRKRKKVAR